MNKSKNLYAPLLSIFGFLLGGYIFFKLWKFYTDAKKTGSAIAGDIQSNTTIKEANAAIQQSGVNGLRAAVVSDAHEDIYAALHKDNFFGFFEDETKAVDAFNTLNTQSEAIACARIYKANWKKSLYGDLMKYVHGDNKIKLKSTLLNAITKL